jgi:hypothetical protein
VTYVRAKMQQPASKEYARGRVARNRVMLAPDPASPGARFTGAYDWFRTAAVYAGRRSYRTLATGEAAIARRDRIAEQAAAMLQEHACRIDAIVPPAPRRRHRRAEFRGAYGRAVTARQRTEAARMWFMFMTRQAERCRGDVAARAAVIKDEAAARLIGWAEEMDADDYGE